MDALALLCTLHADGPATLRILRQADCASLEELERLDVERLADLLGGTPAVARRFLREARNLRARLGEELLEREEAPVSKTAGSTSAAERTAVATAGKPIAPTAIGAGKLGSRDQSIMDRVLSAWRERDAHEASTPETEPIAARASTDRASIGAGSAMSGSAGAPTAGSGLRPGSFDGLTEECCQRLRRAAVRTVAELLERDPLELAVEADLSFTLVGRLQFLARRGERRTASNGQLPTAAATQSIKFSASDAPDDPARPSGGWDFELLPRASAASHAPAQEANRAQDQPADAAGPFA